MTSEVPPACSSSSPFCAQYHHQVSLLSHFHEFLNQRQACSAPRVQMESCNDLGLLLPAGLCSERPKARCFLCVVCLFVPFQIYHSTSEEQCLDISHEKTVKDLMDTSLHSGRRVERQWTYQTCTEFGFCTKHTHTYKITHKGNCHSFYVLTLYLCV